MDINKTYDNLGANCSQLLGIYAVSGCDIVSYPFRKGKIRALNVIMAGNFPGLSEVLGEEHTTDDELLKLGQQYLAALYGQKPGTSNNDAHYNLFTKKKGKLMCIMALPPTDINLL